MVLGLSTAVFTQIHVAISLIGIVSGLVVVFAMARNSLPEGWNILFLLSTIATSVTGFLFHAASFGPPRILGVISLLAIAAALLALYGGHLSGPWRSIYIASAITALYLNVFVGVVQVFQKLPFPRDLAPTQSEPPFVVTQLVVLVVFAALGLLIIRRFRPPAATTA